MNDIKFTKALDVRGRRKGKYPKTRINYVRKGKVVSRQEYKKFQKESELVARGIGEFSNKDLLNSRRSWRDIRRKIEKDKDYAFEQMLFLQEFQTDAEQLAMRTIYKNNVGFNKPDGAFVAKLMKGIREAGGIGNYRSSIGEKEQVKIENSIQKRMKKYSRQLSDIFNDNNRRRMFRSLREAVVIGKIRGKGVPEREALRVVRAFKTSDSLGRRLDFVVVNTDLSERAKQVSAGTLATKTWTPMGTYNTVISSPLGAHDVFRQATVGRDDDGVMNDLWNEWFSKQDEKVQKILKTLLYIPFAHLSDNDRVMVQTILSQNTKPLAGILNVFRYFTNKHINARLSDTYRFGKLVREPQLSTVVRRESLEVDPDKTKQFKKRAQSIFSGVINKFLKKVKKPKKGE